MPAIQLFLFKLKYFPTVWAVKIKSVSAAYKCLVSPPRESPPSALGPGRSAQPARPLLESAARGGRGLSGCPAPQRPSKLFGRLQGHLGDRREGACPDRAEDQTRFASSPPPAPRELACTRRVLVSLRRGCLEPRPRARVCAGCLYSPGVCTRRAEVDGFSFTPRNLALLLPPGVSLLSFLPFFFLLSLPSFLSPFLPLFLSFPPMPKSFSSWKVGKWKPGRCRTPAPPLEGCSVTFFASLLHFPPCLHAWRKRLF